MLRRVFLFFSFLPSSVLSSHPPAQPDSCFSFSCLFHAFRPPVAVFRFVLVFDLFSSVRDRGGRGRGSLRPSSPIVSFHVAPLHAILIFLSAVIEGMAGIMAGSICIYYYNMLQHITYIHETFLFSHCPFSVLPPPHHNFSNFSCHFLFFRFLRRHAMSPLMRARVMRCMMRARAFVYV